MNYILNNKLDSSKVFFVEKSNLLSRWDPFYFDPELVELEKRVRTISSYSLRDFVQSIAGGATPSRNEEDKHYCDSDNGIPFLRVQNITEYGIDLNDVKYITKDTHEGLLKRSRVTENDLLITITGRIGSAAVAPSGFEGNINQHSVVVKTANRLVSETLAAYLNLGIVNKLALRRSTGGTRPALDYPSLLSIPIIYNERIPALLRLATSKYHKQIDEAKRLLESIDSVLLEELGIIQEPEMPNTIYGRIFQSYFSKVTGQRLDPLYYQSDIFAFTQSGQYKVKPLKQITNYFTTGFAAGKGEQADENESIIQIRPTNINDDRELVFRRNIYISISELKNRKADLLRSGEVLFNNTNSQEQVGKTVFFDLNGNYFCSNHITRISVKPDELDPQFLTYLLNLYQRRKIFYRLCTNWNNQSGVGSDILKSIPIPLPEIMRQAEIVMQLNAIRTKASALRDQALSDLESAKREIEALILSKQEYS